LGDITHLTEVRLDIQRHHEKLPIFVTKLGRYPIVLGIPWLKQHDIVICVASNLVTFGSQYCLAHCVDRAVTVRGTSEEPPDVLPIPELPIQLLMSTDEEQDVTDLASSIPSEYHQFLHLFSEVEANKLPPQSSLRSPNPPTAQLHSTFWSHLPSVEDGVGGTPEVAR
jgi:hypothetical protein